ncbi:SPASM domain-containing protein [Thermodesulfobacteriota bacterium]
MGDARQYEELYPLVKRLTKRYRMPIKVDCSLVPMICFHRPDRRALEKLGVFGCEGGNILASMRPDGAVSGCSFDRARECDILELKERWDDEDAFPAYRGWTDHAPEPCASCEYLEICKGGCRVVSGFLTGDPYSPDPECPFCHPG